MNRIRKISCVILIFTILISMAAPSYAATKKAIKSVSVKVDGKISAGQEIGSEDITVTSSGAGYSLDSWEFTNQSFAWEGGEIPEIVVNLKAKDGYYFNIQKASQITLKGATYKTASRQDSATTLSITLLLPAVGLAVGEVEQAELSEKGLCKWNKVENAGSYEIRFMRDSAILGGTKAVGGEPTATIEFVGDQVPAYTYDAMQYVTKGGQYHFKVRAVHKDDAAVKGEWFDSEYVTLSDTEARKVADEYDAIESAGDWLTDAAGSKFRLPDGTILTNTWRRIHREWYYFGANGYMAKGWAQIDGAWYYFDPNTGVMWKNTTTPDGYNLGIDGRRY